VFPAAAGVAKGVREAKVNNNYKVL
jgi:hypothetical protein